MLNDDDHDEFSAKIEDETTYPDDARGIVAIDHGSGSYAEDGPIEIGGGTREIGADLPTPFELFMMGPTQVGAADRDNIEIGSAAMYGQSEIGAADRDDVEIGAADRENIEIGSAAMYGPSEIGSAAMYGPSEIGAIGDGLLHQYEIGAAAAADREGYEIGAEAIVRVVEQARNNRQPPPPMKAVDVDAPLSDYGNWLLTDVVIGAAVSSGDADPFPMFSKLMLRAGTGTTPRFVRVDTVESYRQFRTQNSPELSDLADRVDELEEQLDAHAADPEAHKALAEDLDDLSAIGAEAENAEASKRIDLWMPKRFDGKVEAWREGDYVCASIALPGQDGEIRIATSLEPIRKCVMEMSQHAAEANVPAADVVGALPAMGCVLGAGTLIKEMAAAAPSILQRPEAERYQPFVVRIEPKSSPAIAALAMLAWACRQGDSQACDEWNRLGSAAPAQLRQAMAEALQLVKGA